MGDTCISPSMLAVVTGIVGTLFGYLMYTMNDSIKEARAQRDRMAEGWEQTVGLGEKAIRRERRRA
jgi:CheY-specific phosphatase CheX